MMRTILHEISIWIVVLPFVVGIINYKGLNKDSRWIFLLVAIALIPQVLTAVLRKDLPLLNISYNLYTPIEFGILYVVFVSKYEKRLHRAIVRLTLLVYIAVCAFFFIWYGVATVFLNALVSINNIIYIIWILLLLQEQYQAEDAIIQKANPFAWYLLAIIIYAPCTVVVFSLYHYIRLPSSPVLMNLWIIQSASNILLYTLFTAGLFLRKSD